MTSNIRHYYLIIFSLLMIITKLVLSGFGETGENGEREQLELSYFCDFGIVASFALSAGALSKKYYFVVFLFLISGALFFVSTLLADGDYFLAIKSHLRVYSPLLFFVQALSVIVNREKSVIKWAWIISLFVFALAMLGVTTFEESVNRVTEYSDGVWWGAYYNGLHTTAYTVLAGYSILFVLYSYGHIGFRYFFAITIGVFFSLYLGWGVRTATLAMLMGMLGFVYYKIDNFRTKQIFITLCVSALVLYFLAVFDWVEINQASSGRLEMYKHKFSMLQNSGVIELLIGSGAGSDLVLTDVWWWAEKGSHSDVLTFLVEGGILYLSIYMAMFYRLYATIDVNGKLFLLMALTSSVVSNGYFTRPLPLYVLLFSICCSYALLNCGNKNKCFKVGGSN